MPVLGAIVETGWLPPFPGGIAMCQARVFRTPKRRGRQIKDTMIAMDLAKNAFQLHGASMTGTRSSVVLTMRNAELIVLAAALACVTARY